MYGLTPKSFFWKERWRVHTDYRHLLGQREKEFLAAFNVAYMKGVSLKDAICKGKNSHYTDSHAISLPEAVEARGELVWALQDKKVLHKAIRLLRSDK